MNLGTGLAAAVLVGGQVVQGRHGAAGEIAYNLRGPEDVGRLPGSRATLEDRVSGLGLARRASELAGRTMGASEVFALAATDQAISDLVDGFVNELAFHVVNLATALDPARIAFGGGLVRSWSRIESPVQQALRAGWPFPPEVVVARYPHDAALRGVLALATQTALDGRAEVFA